MQTMTVLAVLAATGYGPMNNESDQFRFVWGVHDSVYTNLIEIGMNTFIDYVGGFWDCRKDCPVSDAVLQKRIADRKARLDRYLRDGIGSIEQVQLAHRKEYAERFPRINRDGTKDMKQVDASNAEFLSSVRKGVALEARTLKGHPAIIGMQTSSEVRDHSHPSFTPETAAAYRRFSGRDIPVEAVGRNPEPYTRIKDFPANRVIPDDYPLLDFYRWIWKTGDGWNDFQTMVADTFVGEFGRPILTMYDPSLRTPPMWGSGGRVSHLNHWTYVYPEPFNISYNISEQQSMARGSDQRVFAMIQAISYRSRLAPIGEHPANEPDWTKEFPNSKYPTTPPDMVREAMWSVFSRKVDGIGFHGWGALFDTAPAGIPHNNDFYQCANPETAKVIGETFRTAGIPLGPLFRAIPERAPEVAVVESYASLIIGGHIAWDCQGAFFDCGVLATAANLMPFAINEEEISTRGIPASVKVLLMPVCDVLTKSCYDRIAEFQRRGGRIVADASLVPGLKSDAELPTVSRVFAEMKDDHDDGSVKGPVIDAAVHDRAFRRAAMKMKAVVAPAARPYTDSDNDAILVSARTFCDADYVFAINDRRAFGDYVGPWRRVLEKGIPNSGTVSVARTAGAVYDLVRHTAVPFKVADGRTLIPVSYRTTDGKVFLVVTKPLGELEVRTNGTRIRVTSPDRNVLIPIEVRAEGRKPFYAVVRDGVWERDFGAELAGVEVVNLADGSMVMR